MDVGMLHLHRTAVTLFLFFLFIKTILLLANKTDTLDKIRNKTKIVDMILGVAMLLTGIYLLFAQQNIATYLYVKTALFFVAVPLGIVGLKKHSKVLAILSLLLFVYIYGMAETRSIFFKKEKVTVENENLKEGGTVAYGKALYLSGELNCINCHGKDGKLGRFNSAMLTESKLTRDEMKNIIRNGKKSMPAYGKQLDEKQLDALVDYLETMRN